MMIILNEYKLLRL